MSAISVEKMGTIDIGRQGENLARTIEIDVSTLLAKWPGATIALLVKRKGDADPYFAEAKVEGQILKWPITKVETDVAGDGKIEIQAILGEVIEKSVTATFRVSASLSGSASDELPEVRPSWVDEVLAGVGSSGGGSSSGGTGGIVTETDPTVAEWAKQPDPPTYTAKQVGADPSGTAAAAVAAHNADEDAHPAIRQLVSGLSGRLNALADSDDTTLDQLSEIVAYIKSNKSLIDGITTGKISTADIVNNLTTNTSTKPLSAAQGVALKKLIDAIVVPEKLSDLADDATHRLTTDAEKAAWNAKSTFSGVYADLTGKPTKVSAFENDAGYLTEHQDISRLLPRTELGAAVDVALAEAKESGEFDGGDGVRGSKILKVTTDTTSYTTTVGGFEPTYRMPLSAVLSESGSDDVLVGDVVWRSYYHYPVGYVDANYVYLGAYINIRGSSGTSVTVKSVSESTEDEGSNVVTFSDGTKLNVKNGRRGEKGEPGKDYVFDPTVYGLPILYLNGDTTGMTKDNAVALAYECEDKDGNAKSGTCSVKWQGSSSIAYAKKNYTVKFDNAFEVVDGWSAQKKYCFKANYIDHSHARNIVSCKLWGQIVKSRTNVDSRLTALPNAGAVDGFPCVIMLNGEFHGLYTWNIPKDGWMYGMSDSTVQQAIVCADKYTDATDFEALAALDGSDYEIEYCSTDDTTWLKTSFNTMLQAVIDSNGSDIDTTLAKYIDIGSAIDYMIDTVLVEAADCVGKNTLLVTYDGAKWFFGAYDRDSTFGLHWHGKDFSGLASTPTFELWKSNKLMNLLWTYKREAIRTRYAEIRAGAMSEANVAKTLWNFCCLIPKVVLLEDVRKWPTIPSSSVNDAHQILHQYRLRCELADEWIKDTSGEKTPPTEESSYTNLVPTSIDTDGSIFNGVGYEDEYRLNSSGVVTSQSDSTATGFMPAAKGDVFRITGVRFGSSATAGVYGYVSIYDASKTKLQSASVDSYLGGSASWLTITPTPSSGYVYPTDIYTIDLAKAPDNVAYVRFSASIAPIDNIAKQSGAYMIVTRNEEIV